MKQCDEFPAICDENADCVSGPHGQYLCQCREGYEENGEICEGKVIYKRLPLLLLCLELQISMSVSEVRAAVTRMLIVPICQGLTPASVGMDITGAGNAAKV